MKYGPWKSDSYYEWREVYGPFDCGEYYCERCGCCMACYRDCCESRGEGTCYAIQYKDELAGDAEKP